jgi:hypothetical protein
MLRDLMYQFLAPTVQVKNYNKTIYRKLVLPVNPQEIRMVRCKMDGDCSIWGFKKKFILGGDWDLETVDILSHAAVRNSFDMVRNDYSWGATNERIRLQSLVEQYGKYDNCRDLVDIDNRLERLRVMALNAYTELTNTGKVESIQPIDLAIDRLGKPVKIGDGQHRLGILSALCAKAINCAVYNVHEQALI